MWVRSFDVLCVCLAPAGVDIHCLDKNPSAISHSNVAISYHTESMWYFDPRINNSSPDKFSWSFGLNWSWWRLWWSRVFYQWLSRLVLSHWDFFKPGDPMINQSFGNLTCKECANNPFSTSYLTTFRMGGPCNSSKTLKSVQLREIWHSVVPFYFTRAFEEFWGRQWVELKATTTYELM